MMNDDIMLLDAYQTIYVWIGNQSNRFEKNGAYKTASRYIQSVRDERDKESVQIVEVEAGKEPPTFTIQFTEWRLDKAQKWLDIAVEKGKEQAATAAPKKTFVTGAPATASSGASWAKKSDPSVEEVKKAEEERQKAYLDPSTNKFTYEQLQGQFPAGVDPTRKEAYLTDAQFLEVFGVTPAAFNELKKWKQQDLKKAKQLF
jgi:hypothetical protein